jgi:PAS domain S-box-containing protein
MKIPSPMRNPINLLPPRLRVFMPLLLAVIAPVLIVTLIAQSYNRRDIEASIGKQLAQDASLIRSMLDREHDMKTEKVEVALKAVEALFSKSELVIEPDLIHLMVTNQVTKEKTESAMPTWKMNGIPILNNTLLIDSIAKVSGGTVTIFQRFENGYLRLATNVIDDNKERATGTYIPLESPVADSISRGRHFTGRAFVVNDWYITAYSPIIVNGEVIGMLYAGDKEKDLPKLRNEIDLLKVGDFGWAAVFDTSGNVMAGNASKLSKTGLQGTLKDLQKTGVLHLPDAQGPYLMAYEYYPGFGLYVATLSDLRLEARSTLRRSLATTTLTGILIIGLISILVWLISTENARKFYADLESSSEKLQLVQKALRESRHDFRSLFNSLSDDVVVCSYDGEIVEANQTACESLGIDKTQFGSLRFEDYLPEEYRDIWRQHIQTSIKIGRHIIEAEMLRPGAEQVPVEIKSRPLNYRGRPVILSIARDIRERKEVEERIMATIIQTEENERKRFSADLHDDLGPILSTIKLYSGSLKKGIQSDKEETVKTIDELTDLAITTAREISRNIRPSILQDFGLPAAINDFCYYINKTQQVNISLETSNYNNLFRGVEETILYHAVKELINNTIKHAQASNIRIELKSFDSQLILYYKDDGVGFNFSQAKQESKGLGLNNIVNKIRSMKGMVDVYSEQGKGMFLIASITVNPNR